MKPNYKQRRSKLKKKIKSQGLASTLLITNIKNVCYLTGFTGSSANLLITPKRDYILSDSRYESQLQTEVSGLEIEIRDASTTLVELTRKILQTLKVDAVCYEADSVTKSTFDNLESALAGIELVFTSGLVEQIRAIKDKFEIAAIRKSIEVNQRAFNVIRAQLTREQTERTVAHNLEHQMRAFGAKGCAFDPIVGVGPRAALPHGRPSEKRIGESPIVLIDWGAEVNLYLSDITRVLVTGKITSRFAKIYNVVLKAQVAAIKKIRPGAKLQSIDKTARRIIESAGYGKYFGHSLGHSFGLEIHEKPSLAPTAEGVLEAGMVVTVEPGIYIPDFAGVRIEDDILVTPDGYEILSNLPKELDSCAVDLD